MPTHLGVKNVDSAAPRSIQVAETAFGKAISIARGKDGRLFIIEVAGGGAHPPILSGHFTRFSDAEDAVKKYVDSGNGRYTASPTRSKLKMQAPAATAATTTQPPSFVAVSDADPGDAVKE